MDIDFHPFSLCGFRYVVEIKMLLHGYCIIFGSHLRLDDSVHKDVRLFSLDNEIPDIFLLKIQMKIPCNLQDECPIDRLIGYFIYTLKDQLSRHRFVNIILLNKQRQETPTLRHQLFFIDVFICGKDVCSFRPFSFIFELANEVGQQSKYNISRIRRLDESY